MMVMQISADFAKDLARAQFVAALGSERPPSAWAILVGAWLLTRLARRLLGRLRIYTVRMWTAAARPPPQLEKRATTIISVLSKLASMVIWIVALVMALNERPSTFSPCWGLGVAGLAVGLGAQALIKDWLGGSGAARGSNPHRRFRGDSTASRARLRRINLRTTVLRGENGAVHIISNGLITTLSNMTRETPTMCSSNARTPLGRRSCAQHSTGSRRRACRRRCISQHDPGPYRVMASSVWQARFGDPARIKTVPRKPPWWDEN